MAEIEKYSLETIQQVLEETVRALLEVEQQGNGDKHFRSTLFSHVRRFGELNPEQQAYIAAVVARMLFAAERAPLALATLQWLESLRANYTVDQLAGLLELIGPLG